MTKEQLKRFLALAFPVVVLAGWTAQHLYTAASGAPIRLRVRAYDPRDMLAGHYLQYQIDYSSDPCQTIKDAEEGCVCFQRSSQKKEAVVEWSGACEARPASCDLWLKGRCRGRFETGLERYYLSEAAARRLPRVPQNSSIAVHLDGSGGGVVTEFFAEGVPLGDYLRQQTR